MSHVSSQSTHCQSLQLNSEEKGHTMAGLVLLKTGGEEEGGQDAFPDGRSDTPDSFKQSTDNDDLEPAIEARDGREETEERGGSYEVAGVLETKAERTRCRGRCRGE